MTVEKTISELARRLAGVTRESAYFEATELAIKAMGIDRGALAHVRRAEFPGECREALDALSAERLSGKPLQYIIGEWEFMGLSFKVDPRALIPRQDTETLAEAALGLIRERGYKTCLDMCAGTGCIGIALARLSGVRTTLADISPEALSLERENAERNGVAAEFAESDMFSQIKGDFDIIVSNPPYLASSDMEHMQRELAFEPESALFGGGDGLDFYRRLALDAPSRLAPGGVLLMEVGAGQAEDVRKMFKNAGVIKDINGIERVVTAEK